MKSVRLNPSNFDICIRVELVGRHPEGFFCGHDDSVIILDTIANAYLDISREYVTDNPPYTRVQHVDRYRHYR